jgi:hypothetical protein
MQRAIFGSASMVHITSQFLQDAAQALQASIQALYLDSINVNFDVLLTATVATDIFVVAPITMNPIATNNSVPFFICLFF